MGADPREIIKNNRLFAVVGATRNKAKYGYEIFRILADYGYKVYPVNPHYTSIDEATCYRSLSELPEKPEVVVTVVPPDVTEKIIDEARQLGIPTVWMPPGAGSAAAVRKCEECPVEHVDESCVILAVKFQGPRSV
jgi:predicted CoA-binding protein